MSVLWIKMLCCFVIIIGCGYIGITFSSRYDSRINQLRGLMTAMRTLEFEICMNNSVLPEALRRAGEAGGAVSGSIFIRCADELEFQRGETVDSLWRNSVIGSNLCLDSETIKLLCEFGITLGSGSRDAESANIKAVLLRLEEAESEAAARRAKNSALYRSLGFAAGMLLSILLL